MPRWNPTPTIIRVLCAKARAERGQVLVEFGLILPVLILIILGIIFFGRYMSYTNQMTQLAEEGARAAALASDPSTTQSIQAYIQSQAQPELQAGSSDVTKAAHVYVYYPTGQTNVVGNSIRVCVTAQFQLPFIGTSASAVESATMRIEQVNPTPLASIPFPTDTPPAGCPTS